MRINGMLPKRHPFRGSGRLVYALSLAAITWLPVLAFANGGHFLPQSEGDAALLFYGDVKDIDGKPVEGATITVSGEGLPSYIAASDESGHYKSVDLGKKVDPAKVEVACTKDGYKQVEPKEKSFPKAEGAVKVDFVLAPEQ